MACGTSTESTAAKDWSSEPLKTGVHIERQWSSSIYCIKMRGNRAGFLPTSQQNTPKCQIWQGFPHRNRATSMGQSKKFRSAPQKSSQSGFPGSTDEQCCGCDSTPKQEL